MNLQQFAELYFTRIAREKVYDKKRKKVCKAAYRK